MSLDFKLHYDRLREGDPTKPEDSAATNGEGAFYEEPSHARNLCLVWANGKRQFLNYAYLVEGEFSPGDEISMIRLNFSLYIVTIKGYCLEALFTALLANTPKQIIQTSERYVLVKEKNRITVTEIMVEKASRY